MSNNAVLNLLSSTVTGLKFSADGSQLFASIGSTISVIDVATGTVTMTYQFAFEVRGFDLSPNGEGLAVVIAEYVFDDTAEFVHVNLLTDVMQTITFGSDYNHRIFNDVAYIDDNSVMLVHQIRAPLRIYEFTTGTWSDVPDTDLSGSFVSSPDGDQIYLVGTDAFGTTLLYTDGEGFSAPYRYYPSPYSGASVPPPLEPIAAVSPDGSIIIRGDDIFDGDLNLIGEIPAAFARNARGMVFSHDSQILYSADPSGLIIAYNVSTWQPIYVFGEGNGLSTTAARGDVLQISPDGSRLSVIAQSGIQIIDIGSAPPLATNGDDILNSSGTLIALDGDDVLGGVGAQRMYGGQGNDDYYFDSMNDRAVEIAGEGYDTIYTSVSMEYMMPDHIEEIIYVGDGDAYLQASFGNQTLRGGNGNDFLSGFLGNDIMIGGLGNDVYEAFDSGDQVIEEANAGTDTVITILENYVLPDHVENLDVGGGSGTIAYGNGLDNVMSGYANRNEFYGLNGNDWLSGGSDGDFLSGGDGNDTVYGENGSDELRGGRGRDELHGGEGSDFLYGDDGTDTLFGGRGDDFLVGGSGSDLLDGGSETDTASYEDAPSSVRIDLSINDGWQNTFGGGTDRLISIENLVASNFDDFVTGSQEDNHIVGLEGNDVINGRDGDDSVAGGTGNDRLEGNNGDDSLFGEADNDTLIGGNGNDQAFGGLGDDMIIGNFGADLLYGEDGDDVIFGGGDSDQIRGGDGRDTIRGGLGDDQIYGNQGVDIVYGGAGADRIFGGVGSDFLYGGNDSDIISGGDGNDEIVGGTGDDSLLGGIGNDLLIGGSGNDIITGDSGNDTIRGGAGDDGLTGGFGSDDLAGGDGTDNLDGGDGADFLSGGASADFLTGGDGSDWFIFDSALGGDNIDSITDFRSADDTIRLDIGVFAGIDLGQLSAAAFAEGPVAVDADDRIIYDAATGEVFYDADGSGAGQQVLFATVDPGTVLTSDDFEGFGAAAQQPLEVKQPDIMTGADGGFFA